MSVSAFRSFFIDEAGQGKELGQEFLGSTLEKPKLLLSTRFTLTTHICLQGPVDKGMDKMSNIRKECKNLSQ